MRTAVKLTMIFVLRWFYLTPGQTAEDVSTCNATAAELTTEATVTCLFPVDITKSKLGFRVHHYQHYLSESVVVVSCMWTSGMPQYWVKSGYKAGDLTSESFTLRIPHFLPNHTGGYLCDLDGYYNESCTLHQLAGTRGSQGFAIVSAEAAPAVVAPATVLLIVIIIIIIIIAFTQYRLRRKRRMNDSRTPGQDRNDNTNTDQREELINQSEECGSDRHLSSLRSRATTSCETCSRQLSACEEHGQQASLVSTYEVSSTSPKSLSKHADVISAITSLCTEVVKQNAATKLSCQLDADGSLNLVCESGFSGPRVIPEQEPHCCSRESDRECSYEKL